MSPTTHRPPTLLAGALSVALAGLGLAACSSSGTPATSTGSTGPGSAGGSAAPTTKAPATSGTAGTSTGTSGTAAGTTPAGGGASATISVRMKEWDFVPSAATAKAGKVTFSAVNEGKQVHELVVFKTDLAPEALPLDEDGAVDEKGAGLEFVDEVEDVAAGSTKSFTVDLAPGNYLIVCNLVDNGDNHFDHKMYAPLVVS